MKSIQNVAEDIFSMYVFQGFISRICKEQILIIFQENGQEIWVDTS